MFTVDVRILRGWCGRRLISIFAVITSDVNIDFFINPDIKFEIR